MTTNSDQIRILFLEQLMGTLSEPDARLLKQLLENDTAARELWAELQARSASLEGHAFAAGLDPSAELDALHRQQGYQEVISLVHPSTKAAQRTSSRQWYAWAAAVLVLAAAAGSYFITRTDTSPSPEKKITRNFIPTKKAVQLLVPGRVSLALTGDSAVQFWQVGQVQVHNDSSGLAYSGIARGSGLNTLLVPAGEDYRITLSDGTEVWLNAASQLRFPFNFTGTKREIYLEGEAWFKVAPNSQQPFIVHTPNTTVAVLGTTFNINSYDDEKVRVSLLDGAVEVKGTGDEPVTLKPGTEAVYGDYNGIRTGTFDPDEVLSWMKGIRTFHHLKLRELKPQLERWFAVAVVFDSPEAGNTVVTGLMEKNKLTPFLNDLETAGDIKYYFSNNELHFTTP